MRVINIVKVSENIVTDIESIAIVEEQFSDDIIQEADDLFLLEIRDLGFDGNDEDFLSIIKDGYYQTNDLSVCICWSEI